MIYWSVVFLPAQDLQLYSLRTRWRVNLHVVNGGVPLTSSTALTWAAAPPGRNDACRRVTSDEWACGWLSPSKSQSSAADERGWRLAGMNDLSCFVSAWLRLLRPPSCVQAATVWALCEAMKLTPVRRSGRVRSALSVYCCGVGKEKEENKYLSDGFWDCFIFTPDVNLVVNFMERWDPDACWGGEKFMNINEL